MVKPSHLESYDLSSTPEWIFTVEVSTHRVCESHIRVTFVSFGFSVHFTFFRPARHPPYFTGCIMPSFEQADFKPPSTNDDDNSLCSSSYDIGSSSGGESRAAAAAAKADSDNKDDSLTWSEKSIRRSKMLVYTALLLTAAIGTLIYFLMSNEELATCQQDVRSTFAAQQ
jgi:hypothetical protein